MFAYFAYFAYCKQNQWVTEPFSRQKNIFQWLHIYYLAYCKQNQWVTRKNLGLNEQNCNTSYKVFNAVLRSTSFILVLNFCSLAVSVKFSLVVCKPCFLTLHLWTLRPQLWTGRPQIAPTCSAYAPHRLTTIPRLSAVPDLWTLRPQLWTTRPQFCPRLTA